MLEGLPLGYKSADISTLGFVSAWIMWITLLKYNWEKNLSCDFLWKRCFLLHSVMFEQLRVFFSLRFFLFLFFSQTHSLHSASIVPRTDHTSAESSFLGNWTLELTNNINGLGVSRFPRVPGLPSALLSVTDPVCGDQQVHQSVRI